MSEPILGAAMPVAEHGLQRRRMSWEAFLRLVMVALRTHLRHLVTVTEVGVWLPRNRLRAPDLVVVERRPEGRWVTDPPVLVVEVLSPGTRSEDTMRKSREYLAAGIAQYWVVDPEARAVDVFAAVDGEWERVLRLDDTDPTGEVVVEGHGTVPLDLRGVVRGDPPHHG